jgi:hypothetical protein
MKTTNIHPQSESPALVSLHQVVDQLIKTSSHSAVSNTNSVVNNVSPKFHINIKENVIASVIGGMLRAFIANTTESVIYVSAREWYDKMIEVIIRDNNCYNTYAVALGLQDSVRLAESIHGHLDILNQKQKITTISFRFPVVDNSAS